MGGGLPLWFCFGLLCCPLHVLFTHKAQRAFPALYGIAADLVPGDCDKLLCTAGNIDFKSLFLIVYVVPGFVILETIGDS